MGLKKRANSASDSGFISQIVYPKQELSQFHSHAFLVGWSLENFRCTIACLAEVPPGQLSILEYSLVESTSELRNMMAAQGPTRPVILGEIFRSVNEVYVPSADKQAHSMWITLTLDSTNQPRLISLYSLGCKYETSCYMFGYYPANASSLECYHVDRRKIIISESSERHPKTAQTDLWSHSDLDLIVNHINTAQELHQRMQHHLEHRMQGTSPIARRSLYFTEDSLFDSKTEYYTCSVVSGVCLALSKVVYVWCYLLRQVNRSLNHKYVLFTLGTSFSQWLGISGSGGIETSAYNSSPSPISSDRSKSPPNNSSKGVTLRDLSLTGAYIAERCTRTLAVVQKCAFFPQAWLLPPALKQHIWIDVHSYLFLLWLDIVLGLLFGYVVFTHADSIVHDLQRWCGRVQTGVIFDTLEWFNHSPGGVKLNTIITRKFGALIVILLKAYDNVVLASEPLQVSIVCMIACFGAFGFTVQLVLLVDIARMLTLHIALIHRALSYLHEFLLQCLHSLWLLFQGQKKNVLRKRIDTCRFGQDQLLFGIVMFSILFFVFPSFAAYFLLFALAQLSCVAFQYVVYSLSVAVKEFPYYEAFLYVLRPGMQSDGVQFKVLTSAATPTAASATAPNVRAPAAKGPITAPVVPPPRQSLPADRTDAPVVVSQPRQLSQKSANLSDANAGSSGNLRGILKTSDQGAGAAPTTLADPTSSSAVAKGRVSFQASTVRTIPQYHSDENSPTSDADSDEQGDVTAPLLYRQSYVHPGTKEREERLSGKQQWNMLMNLQLPSNQSANTSSTDTSSYNSGAHSGVAYIELTARTQSKARLFSCYLKHLTYLTQEREIALRLLRGIVYGRPALDIQLIHGTSDISDQQESGEQAVLDDIANVLVRAESLTQETSAGATPPSPPSPPSRRMQVLLGRDGTYFQQYSACIRAAVDGAEAPIPAGENASAKQRGPLRSRQCRSMSRRMLLAVLVTLAVQCVLCLLGFAVFVNTLRVSWVHGSGEYDASLKADVSPAALNFGSNTSVAIPLDGPLSSRKMVAVDLVPMYS